MYSRLCVEGVCVCVLTGCVSSVPDSCWSCHCYVLSRTLAAAWLGGRCGSGGEDGGEDGIVLVVVVVVVAVLVKVKV